MNPNVLILVIALTVLSTTPAPPLAGAADDWTYATSSSDGLITVHYKIAGGYIGLKFNNKSHRPAVAEYKISCIINRKNKTQPGSWSIHVNGGSEATPAPWRAADSPSDKITGIHVEIVKVHWQ